MRASVATAGPGDLNTVEASLVQYSAGCSLLQKITRTSKTSQTVTSLMDSVKGLEEEIGRQRYTYNNISQEFNTMMDTIPSNIVGHLIHLTKLEYLQFEEAIQTPPKIEF